jgi:hypothetical protein
VQKRFHENNFFTSVVTCQKNCNRNSSKLYTMLFALAGIFSPFNRKLKQSIWRVIFASSFHKSVAHYFGKYIYVNKPTYERKYFLCYFLSLEVLILWVVSVLASHWFLCLNRRSSANKGIMAFAVFSWTRKETSRRGQKGKGKVSVCEVAFMCHGACLFRRKDERGCFSQEKQSSSNSSLSLSK